MLPRFGHLCSKRIVLFLKTSSLVNSLSGLTYENRLIALGIPTLEYRSLKAVKADVIEVFKILNQIDRIDPNNFYHVQL